MPTAHNPPWEVLIVDDDEAIRELVGSYFNGLGLIVTSAPDGSAAIATLQRSNGRFGMVVTDLNLPGADGFAVLQAARKANPACYVVIITGYASLDSAIHAVRVGAYDYLTKPFSLAQLAAVVARTTQHAARGRHDQTAGYQPPESYVPPDDKRAAATVRLTALEESVSRIEAAVARIESRLNSGAGSPFSRR